MARFEFLNKSLFRIYANKIFNILADNMSIIAPTGNCRDEDFKLWYHAVSDGLKKDNRRIILIFERGTNGVIGFFQYYTTIDTFMMEEIQICSEFQAKDNIFRDLYSFVLNHISTDLLYVEAYANKLNHKSIGILGKLGLKVIGENKNGESFHFKGKFDDLMRWHLNRSLISTKTHIQEVKNMIYKNVEIHNIAELIHNDDGSVSWKRVPTAVHSEMEAEGADAMVHNSTGVELRFVIKGDSATIRMSTYEDDPKSFATFHVYRGGIQGGWSDHEVHRHVTGEIQDFVIEKSNNIARLKEMSEKIGYEWDSEVVRIIFDRGRYKIYDIIGDVEPPSEKQCPKKTLLSYGSSITHGSNSIDMSHSWVSVLAHNMKMDARNLGMAGSCAMEPAMAEFIASEGEKGKWDIATLELGINVLDWEDEKIINRVENIIKQVAGRNADKHIFVISPFYHCGDDFNVDDNAKNWRKIIEAIVKKLHYPNVTYINGLDCIGDMSYMSADEVHPNIYGVQRIADVMTERIEAVVGIGGI